jgi:hypothetical protein
VFWIHASNTTRFEQSYQEIASIVGIPERNDPEINVFQLVNIWLYGMRDGRWLMVLDNADDNNVFFDASKGNAPLADYLPQASNGSILITLRNKLAAKNLAGTYGTVIPVEPISANDAVALLQTCIQANELSENDAHALVKALEYIPLAITQAGAYIANCMPRITAQTYLKLFRESKSNQEHLLKYDGAKDLRRDKSIRVPVIITWQILFDQIRCTSPAASDLLALMSMFDQQGIPADLIKQGMNQLDFEDTVDPLISFSLIRTEVSGHLFVMH